MLVGLPVSDPVCGLQGTQAEEGVWFGNFRVSSPFTHVVVLFGSGVNWVENESPFLSVIVLKGPSGSHGVFTCGGVVQGCGSLVPE